MKPTLVLISILLVLILVSIIGYALGQLGNTPDCECPAPDSVQEIKAGLSDLASAMAKIEVGDNPEQAYLLLQEFHSCWPKLMGRENPAFSDSEEMAMTMVTVGMLLSLSVWSDGFDPLGERFDEAMEKCANLK